MENVDEITLLHCKLVEVNAEFTEYVYRTSHDVKGPLATIRGLTNLAKLDSKKDELNKYLEMIIKVTDKLDAMLGYLMHSSELEVSAHFEVCLENFFSQVLDALSMLKTLHNINFKLQIIETERTKILVLYPNQISTLLDNILLILTSYEPLVNLNFTVHLSSTADGVLIEIIYPMTCRQHLESALKNTYTGKLNLFILPNYSDLRYGIINRCLKISGASINIVPGKNNAIVKIYVPSMVRVSDHL